MTRDDIINLMKRDGSWDYFDLEGDSVGILMLVTLCQDVAAPLKERIEVLYEQIERTEKMLDDQYKMGMEAEREACAQLMFDIGSLKLANAIRERGDKPCK